MRKKENDTKDNIVDAGGSPEAAKRNDEIQKSEERKRKLIFLLICICVIVGIVVFFVSRNRQYKGYKVVESSQTDYENTASYIQFGDNLLKYTPDGVSYINAKGETIWTTGINMKIPMAVSSGDYAVVADMNGNTVCVFSAEGEVSSQTMPYPICDVDVGNQGVFAVVLESDKTNYINMYNRKGEIIYEIQTTIDKSGYPLDITISDNGEKLFTSYMNVGNNVMENNLAAYNFGEVGQNSNADRVVGGYKFSDQVFSKVEFVNNDTVVAFGTKTIEIYAMKEKPSLRKSLSFDREIRSIFYGEDYIGVLQRENGEDQKHLYAISVYNLRGKLEFIAHVDFDYDNIFATDDEIIITGGNDCVIFRTNGTVKFEGKLQGRIKSIVPSGKHLEYVVVYENETQVIKLKGAEQEQQDTMDKTDESDVQDIPMTTEQTPDVQGMPETTEQTPDVQATPGDAG